MSVTQHGGEPVGQDGARGFQFDFREQLRLLRKRLWLLVATTALAAAAGGGYYWSQPRVYRATGILHIDTAAPRVLGDLKDVVSLGAGDYWSNKEFYETEYRIISSRDVIERVVAAQGLDRDAEFLGLGGVADDARRAELLSHADAIGALQARLKVDPVKNSQLVEVSIEDTSPERAAALVEAVMSAYIGRNLDRRLEGTRAASDWLSSQLGDLKAKLEASELDLYTFKKDQDFLSASMEDRQNITAQRLVALNDSLTKILTRKAELQAALAEAESIQQARPDDPLWAATVPQVAESGMVSELRREYIKQANEVAALSERYLDRHPQRVAAEERLSGLRTKLSGEMEKVVAGMRSQSRELLATERRLGELIDGVKREALEVNKKEIDYRKLSREQENRQRLYELVLTRLKEADLTALLKTNNIRRLDAPVVPERPIRPRPLVIALFSLLAGLTGGMALILALAALDNTLKNEEDVERILGVPFLGILPTIDIPNVSKDRSLDGRRDLFVLNNPKSAAAECCRAVRTNLLFMSPERQLRKIVVTSSGPQEGKTTTCINVGIAMAQAGSRVLLVDTDMRRPRLHRALGVGNELGLSTLILGETQIESAIKTTDVPNLWVLPCGPIPPNPAELLHTARFRELLDELAGRYDRVIFDTPPLIAVTDAAILATLADGVMVVTRFRKTTRELAQRSLRSLRDVNATILGAVMNDVNLTSREYDYYYSRRYGSYYSDDSAKA